MRLFGFKDGRLFLALNKKAGNEQDYGKKEKGNPARIVVKESKIEGPRLPQA
jgi:hypothetical protein